MKNSISMKYILNEGISSEVYHFTTLVALKKIMLQNRLDFSCAVNDADRAGQPKGMRYFLSLTRQPSFDVGFAASQNAGKNNGKLEFDLTAITRKKRNTKQLKQLSIDEKIELSKYDFLFATDKGEYIFVKDANKEQNRIKLLSFSETEERIFSKTPYFRNIFNFIKRIDIVDGVGNFCVRITFDSEMLKRKYRGKQVDFFYQKYLKGLSEKKSLSSVRLLNIKTFFSLNENDVNVSNAQLDIADDAKKPTEISIKPNTNLFDVFSFAFKQIFYDKNEDAILWATKIFYHPDSTLRHKGTNLLNAIESFKKNEKFDDIFKKSAIKLASRVASSEDERIKKIFPNVGIDKEFKNTHEEYISPTAARLLVYCILYLNQYDLTKQGFYQWAVDNINNLYKDEPVIITERTKRYPANLKTYLLDVLEKNFERLYKKLTPRNLDSLDRVATENKRFVENRAKACSSGIIFIYLKLEDEILEKYKRKTFAAYASALKKRFREKQQSEQNIYTKNDINEMVLQVLKKIL
jgi:hypothetical protein